MGIPEYEARLHEGKLNGGRILISTHSEDNTQTERAKQIFKAANAEDISPAKEPATSGTR